MADLPLYRCHKLVRAARIERWEQDGFGVTRLFLSTGDHLRVEAGWIESRKAQAGGYFVQYEDGYQSYSPAAAFEAGYTLEPT